MNPDGTGLRQLTFNTVDDHEPALSPDGKKIAYESQGNQTSNPEGDQEIYVMNTLDGTGKKNLTNNGSGVNDFAPVFSPDGRKVAYESCGNQTSNPEGDNEIYRMNALDGSGKKNLSNNGAGRRRLLPRLLPRRHEDRLHEPGRPDLQPRGRRRGLPHERHGRVGQEEPLQQRRRRRRLSLPTSLPTARRSPTRATATRPPIPRATRRSTA